MLERMVQRSRDKGFNFPYVRDETQDVARKYGGTCAPHVFAFDEKRVLQYKGRIDDNRNSSAVKTKDPGRLWTPCSPVGPRRCERRGPSAVSSSGSLQALFFLFQEFFWVSSIKRLASWYLLKMIIRPPTKRSEIHQKKRIVEAQKA